MRLVGVDGEPIGIVKLAEAFRKSEELDVDLVEIAPQAAPPVCRLMDYGKFKYQEAKKQHEAKLKQKVIQVKEVKFRPGTDDGDYNVKLRNLVRFLEEGDKTKITLRFAAVKWLTRKSACACSSACAAISTRSARSSRCRRWKGAR